MSVSENSNTDNNMEKKMQTTKPSSLASVAGNREQRVPGTNLLGTGLETRGVHAWFGTKHVLSDVSLDFAAGTVTALIGPSGCGKSTYLRTLNRMHEFIPTAALAGEVLLDGKDIYAPGTDVTKIRLRVGMVFQKPNPFPSMTMVKMFCLDSSLLNSREATQMSFWSHVCNVQVYGVKLKIA